MSLYVPTAAGMVHSDVDALVGLIQNGDGMGWPGDPRMYVTIGVLSQTKNGRVRTGRRYEVRRWNEDGSIALIGHWRLDEKDKIIFELSRMRMDSPGHVDTLAEIDKTNAAIEQKATDVYMDSQGEMLSHAASIVAETEYGKNTFRQMPGTRDEPKVDDAG